MNISKATGFLVDNETGTLASLTALSMDNVVVTSLNTSQLTLDLQTQLHSAGGFAELENDQSQTFIMNVSPGVVGGFAMKLTTQRLYNGHGADAYYYLTYWKVT
jgi:hypothetical protein